MRFMQRFKTLQLLGIKLQAVSYALCPKCGSVYEACIKRLTISESAPSGSISCHYSHTGFICAWHTVCERGGRGRDRVGGERVRHADTLQPAMRKWTHTLRQTPQAKVSETQPSSVLWQSMRLDASSWCSQAAAAATFPAAVIKPQLKLKKRAMRDVYVICSTANEA